MSQPPRPIAARRHDEILRRLSADGNVSVEEMALVFDVSRETIRRDLKALAGRGHLAIVHGGATRRADEPALADRQSDNPEGKAAIGRAGARLVEDGMVVLLDSGATTLALAHALAGLDPSASRERPAWTGLTICTNSLPIGLCLCRIPGIRVHMLGGEVSVGDEAAFGTEAIAALARFRADLAFVGAGGISSAGEITDFALLPTDLRARMLASAERAYIVADRTKFGRLTPIRLQPIPRGTGLIVDAAPPPAMAGALAERGLDLVLAR
ncbi:DeoR/GlpR family DNA-binding transcription regulator [Methylobacterium soli]|uniref:DeoR/GlpR transcriptional regulator n=1 Tax=Methylobacterium soli TaxID=553447 RepID=A0A6L3STP4_9HYPH|nr:DeoR/GlpR family DNA-binding transcription regulator [Methylobacterium soli]KAB1076549.1 DeoR/GlpR transcriptional regulator [Methylobacterium soli]GJE40998.1 HTH-type transcriptional repressor CsqR [Methylobacterium soli]